MVGMSIGIDVGGTFTDAVLTDGAKVWTAKAPTTENVVDGVLGACALAAKRAGGTLEEVLLTVQRFGLGTTAITNVIASRRGVRVGLITTKGFEETLRLARGRMVTEDQRLDHGPELVAPEDIIGINERVDRNGAVLQPLDLAELRGAATRLVESGVEAIAVSFLWSMLNTTHEAASVEAISEKYPNLPVTSGSSLFPVLREYERTTLAVLNAYASGVFAGVEELEKRLAAGGLTAPLLLVHSGGGTISVAEARRRPVWLAASGPAAGVAAAAALALQSGAPNCITCDMGGTSFDVSDVRNGVPSRISRGDLMGFWTALPRVDVESIGAGGGSIGWVDARGMLRVGPHSAGSYPGPVCYGRGGEQPTVTDALVVLRYIDADNFLGGDMRLDRSAAIAACARLDAQLGMDAESTAWGIREIALAEMTKAARTRLAMRGLDPREHPLVSYGGCGSLFTADIAKLLAAPSVIVPDTASVLSAQGAATMNVRRERMRTVLLQMPVDIAALQKVADALALEVTGDIAADGVAEANRQVLFEADMRFTRQMWELSIPLPATITEAAITELLEGFRAEYIKRYGVGSIMLGTPVELVALRAIGLGAAAPIELTRKVKNAAASVEVDRSNSRSVRVGGAASASIDVAVVSDTGLGAGQWLTGPGLIDRSDTTIWVPEGMRASRDNHANIVLEALA